MQKMFDLNTKCNRIIQNNYMNFKKSDDKSKSRLLLYLYLYKTNTQRNY